jgi:hypothetical protein
MRITHLCSYLVALAVAGVASTAQAQPAGGYRWNVEFGLGFDNSINGGRFRSCSAFGRASEAP